MLDAHDDASHDAPITGRQCAAARAALGISANELATLARINRTTLRRFEAQTHSPFPDTALTLKRILEERGASFTNADNRQAVSFPNPPGANPRPHKSRRNAQPGHGGNIAKLERDVAALFEQLNAAKQIAQNEPVIDDVDDDPDWGQPS